MLLHTGEQQAEPAKWFQREAGRIGNSEVGWCVPEPWNRWLCVSLAPLHKASGQQFRHWWVRKHQDRADCAAELLTSCSTKAGLQHHLTADREIHTLHTYWLWFSLQPVMKKWHFAKKTGVWLVTFSSGVGCWWPWRFQNTARRTVSGQREIAIWCWDFL